MHSLYVRFVLWLIGPAVERIADERIAAAMRQGGQIWRAQFGLDCVRLPDRIVTGVVSPEVTFRKELSAYCDERIRAWAESRRTPSGRGIRREPIEAPEQQSSSHPSLLVTEKRDGLATPALRTDRIASPSVDRAPDESQRSPSRPL
jgi:hypothetical protein